MHPPWTLIHKALHDQNQEQSRDRTRAVRVCDKWPPIVTLTCEQCQYIKMEENSNGLYG